MTKSSDVEIGKTENSVINFANDYDILVEVRMRFLFKMSDHFRLPSLSDEHESKFILPNTRPEDCV